MSVHFAFLPEWPATQPPRGPVSFLSVPLKCTFCLTLWLLYLLGQIVYECVLFLQTPWLLSLQGELVASLEDASQVGLHTDINKKQDLLQRHGQWWSAALPRGSRGGSQGIAPLELLLGTVMRPQRTGCHLSGVDSNVHL